MPRRADTPPPVQPKEWRSTDEIDRAIAELERRIEELEALDVRAANLKGPALMTSRRAMCGRLSIRVALGTR